VSEVKVTHRHPHPSIASKERREFLRVEEQVVLNYRVVTEEEAAAVAARLNAPCPDRFTVAARFESSTTGMAHLLHGLAGRLPEVAACVRVLDQKLNDLARLLLVQETDCSSEPPRLASLSAGGLAFGSREQLAEGDLLELKLVLPGAMIGILTVARVVHVEHLPGAGFTGGYPWWVGVQYLHIRESDRDLLVKHVMQVQISNQ
jgi:hypothetical protein